VIEVLAGQGQDVKRCCDMLAVSNSGYYAWKGRPPSAAALRRTWLGGLILDIHAASDETYGSRRVTAELRLTHEQRVGHNTVARIMRDLALRGLPARKRGKSGRMNLAGTRDLVMRDFDRDAPNRLWMTDIT
jgi:putative transposase